MDKDSGFLKRYNRASQRELVIIGFIALVFFLAALRFNLYERVLDFCIRHENLQIDEIIMMINVVFFAALIFSWRRWRDIQALGKDLVARNRELQDAMDQIKILQGVLPICSNCKRIRDENNQWHQMEEYMSVHSEAEFSHGLCPDCARKLYPRLYQKEGGNLP